MPIASIHGMLELRDVYERVTFIPEVVARITRELPADEDDSRG